MGSSVYNLHMFGKMLHINRFQFLLQAAALGIVFSSNILQLPVLAQPRVIWQTEIEGRRDELRAFRQHPLDSLDAIVNKVLRDEKEEGYYWAEIDKITVTDTTSTPIYSILHINRGPQAEISDISISGLDVLTRAEFFGEMSTRVGRVLSQEVLLRDIDRILRQYELRGYPFASVSIDSISVFQENEPALRIALRVVEGDRVKINDVVLSGGKRTSVSYVEQITGLRKGDWLDQDLDEVYRALVSSQLFSQVQAPQLVVIGRGVVVVQIPVKEEAPGSFDLVLGYQPPSAGTQSQGLVGNGRLTLINMFGRGRRIGLRLNRLPGQVSSVEAAFKDPYVFGLPFSIEVGFDGLQQDSTYGQQAYRGAIGYKMQGGLETFLTVSREVTKPGQAGLNLQSGLQRIPRSEIIFAGISVRYETLDRPINPQRGFLVETRLERGQKVRNSRQIQEAGDTTSVRSELRQERLILTGRAFIPTFNKQVLVLGNDTRALASKDFDASDLFRLGGAQTLRGYDEDRFRGRLVSRSLVEYRYLFERESFAYLFFDLGYVDRPATPELEAMRGFYPGYGLGMQFETGIGLINTSLALSTSDNPSQAKVHVGLSLGL